MESILFPMVFVSGCLIAVMGLMAKARVVRLDVAGGSSGDATDEKRRRTKKNTTKQPKKAHA